MAFFGRGKNKNQDPFTIPDMYKEYKEEYEHDQVYNVEYKLFVSVVEDFYKEMMDKILLNGTKFKLPYRLGFVQVLKRKMDYKNNLAIDWDKTNKTGKKIYHINDHTGGFKYFFRWDKTGVIFKHKSLYRLVMTRTHKRMLAKLIKTGQDYYELQIPNAGK